MSVSIAPDPLFVEICTYTSVCAVDDIGNVVCRYFFFLTPGGLVQVCRGWVSWTKSAVAPYFSPVMAWIWKLVGSGGYP